MSKSEQAAEWLLRLHAKDVGVAERYQYLQWLKRSPEHVGEALEMGSLYSLLYSLRGQLYFTNEDSVSNVVKIASSSRSADIPPVQRPKSKWRGQVRAAAVMAAAAVLLGIAVERTWLDYSVETQPSEWRNFALTDGSLVGVGPRTQLRDQLDEQQRVIRLAQGEAMFQVAKDRSRPFIVDAGLVLVRATGTRFAVSRREHEVVVTVEEGSVAVTNSARSAADEIALEAGDQIRVANAWPVPVRRVNLERELAWTQRRLFFQNEPLAQVVEEFNRRNRVQIVVDPALRAGKVQGVFRADDPQSFAELLAAGKQAAVVHQSRDVLRLSATQPGQ